MNIYKYQWVLFDLDGVIYSHADFIADAYKEAARVIMSRHKELKLKVPSKKQIMAEVGRPSGEIVKTFFPELEGEFLEEMKDELIDRIRLSVMEGRGKVYDGIREVVTALSTKVHLAIISNGRREYITAVLKAAKLEKYFPFPLVTIGKKVEKKSDIIRRTVPPKDIASKSVLFIGDRIGDYEAAKELRIDFLGANWGHALHMELTPVPDIIDKPGQIMDFVK